MQEPSPQKSALADRGAQSVEERIASVETVHKTLVSKTAVGNDRLRAVLGDDGFPAGHDLIERFVPGYAGEGSLVPLGPTRRIG